MNILKSKLPKIEISKISVQNSTIEIPVATKKKKYLDDLISKEFINRYFHEKSKN